MPNPAPFPGTAYDTADWLRATTLYTSAGTPAPYTAGNPPVANHYQSVSATASNTGHTTLCGPNDGAQHSLLTVLITVTPVAATVTGVAYFQAVLQDRSTIDIVGADGYFTGFPTSDQMPSKTIVMEWSGGLVIPIQAGGTSQLQISVAASAVGGGTISAWSVFSQTYMSWT